MSMVTLTAALPTSRSPVAKGAADMASQYWLEYQPIYRPGELFPCKAEALLRRRTPDDGLTLPGRFLPGLEASGHIHRVGEWVLEQACRQALEWRRASSGDVRIAVNVSPVQLGDLAFVAIAERVLKRTGCPAAWIELEITEGVMFDDLAAVKARLHGLAALGFTLSIDDFGVGYSSLTRLATLPVDHIKIEGSLLRAATGDGRKARVMDALIAMARSLGFGVTVEGVECHEHLMLVSAYEGISVQGFYLGRPMSGEALCRLENDDLPISHVIAA